MLAGMFFSSLAVPPPIGRPTASSLLPAISSIVGATPGTGSSINPGHVHRLSREPEQSLRNAATAAINYRLPDTVVNGTAHRVVAPVHDYVSINLFGAVRDELVPPLGAKFNKTSLTYCSPRLRLLNAASPFAR
jgi:hypothetical protein